MRNTIKSYWVSPLVVRASAALAGVLLTALGMHAEEDRSFQDNALLERGISFGNALDAPTEGAWGVTLKEQYFQAVEEAGFTSVRLPIRWSAHGAPTPPYTIAPGFFARVDWAVQQALSRHMSIVIDMHHFVEMHNDPEKQSPRLLALWDQIASHYRNFPKNVFFELLNEPSNQLTDDRWQNVMLELVQTIRKTNPDRQLIIGPGFWNSLDHLDHLHLPDSDRRLIATFHYYIPMRFTHQGAKWVKGADQWKDVTWGTADEQKILKDDFDKAASWARANHRALYMGEFGTFNGDMESRVRWTRAVAREAEQHQISWAYWEFFVLYDTKTNTWREQLMQALLR